MAHQVSRHQQESALLPPDMYETSVSTSASGSWSTSGSRGLVNGQQQQQQQQHQSQQQQQQYVYGGYPHHQHRHAQSSSSRQQYREQQHHHSNSRAHSPAATSHSPTSVPSMGSQGSSSQKYPTTTSSQGPSPTSPRTNRPQYHYQPHVPDETHSWTPAPPPYNSAASKLSSRYRPVGYRPDYSRSQHRAEQQQQQQPPPQEEQFYSSRQHSADREPRRDRERSPVSEPNFGNDTSRFMAHVTRFATHDPRSTPSPVMQQQFPNSSDPQSPSVSERIQKFSGNNSHYPDPEPVYHHEDGSEQHCMEHPQQEQYQPQQHQQQPQQHQPQTQPQQYQPQRRQYSGSSRARALAQRFESATSGAPPPQQQQLHHQQENKRMFASPPPPDEYRKTSSPPVIPNIEVHNEFEDPQALVQARSLDDAEQEFQFREAKPHYRHANVNTRQPPHAISREEQQHQVMPPQDHPQYEDELHDHQDNENPHPHGSQQERSVHTDDDIPHHYSLDDTIETPSVASVTELRRRLWDDDESLQVAVKPSLHQHGDAHSRHWMYFYGPEMAGRQGQRYGKDDIVSSPLTRKPDTVASRPGQRLSRSLSPARPQYRRRREASQPPQQQYASQPQQQRQKPVSASEVEAGQEASSNGVVFKSKFYQAAIAARRTGKGFSKSPTQTSSSGTKQQWLEPLFSPPLPSPPPQSMPDPATAPTPPNNNNNVWRHPQDPSSSDHHHQQQQQPDTIERVYSSDPTNGGNSDESSVARLVAQLNAVPRKDPASALQKIDSILRAESRSSSGGASPNVATGSTDQALDGTPSSYKQPSNSFHPNYHQHNLAHDRQNGHGHEESSEEETDDETSVSSITNPTYASAKPAGDPDQAVSVPSLSTAMHRRPRPNPLQMYGQYHEDVVRGKSSSKKKMPRSPPPETIKVGGKEPKAPKVVLPLQLSVSKDEESDAAAGQGNSKTQPLKGGASAGGKPKTAASIALKIRMWDELSAPNSEPGGAQSPQSPRSGASETAALSTVNTEDLGSIMTPADAAKAEGVVKAEGLVNRRSHPWDDHIPHNNQDLDKSGDAFDVNPALLHEFSSEKQQPRTRTQNLSEDFDAAWVSLPANAFFPASPTAGLQSQQQRQRSSPRTTGETNHTVKLQPKFSKNPTRTRQPVTRPPPNAFAGKADLLPSSSRASNPVADAFAGKEDLLPPATTSTAPANRSRASSKERFEADATLDASKVRRSKLLNKIRKNKAASMAPTPAAAPPPQPVVFHAASPTRTNKPLLSPYAMDSVDGKTIANKQKAGRSKSKSPGRLRLGGGSTHSDSGANRKYLAKKFSRLMKVYDDKD